MAETRVEYMGFKAQVSTREYRLRVRPSGGEAVDFILAIANEAFLSHRVRYQDAPDICFAKLHRELAAVVDGAPPALYLSVSDAELEEYRTAHSPRPKPRRVPVPEPSQS